jgi:hypothetical protein
MFLFRPRFRSSEAHWPSGRGLGIRLAVRITLPRAPRFILANVAKDGTMSQKQLLVCTSMLGWEVMWRTVVGSTLSCGQTKQSYATAKSLYMPACHAMAAELSGDQQILRQCVEGWKGNVESTGLPRRKGPAVTATSSQNIQRMANCCRERDGLGVAPSQMCVMARKTFQSSPPAWREKLHINYDAVSTCFGARRRDMCRERPSQRQSTLGRSAGKCRSKVSFRVGCWVGVAR